MERTFSTRVACEMARLSYRRLDYWCRTGVIVASVPATGSGSRRRFTYAEVRVMAFMRLVSDALGGNVPTDRLARIAWWVTDDPTLLDAPGLYVDLTGGVVSLTRRPFAIWLPADSYAVANELAHA